MRATMLPVWITVGLLGCKMKGDGAMAQKGLELEVAAGSAAPGSMEMMKADVAGKEESKPAEGAKPAKDHATWKRSQIVPNSSRVMVGDREELALRSMQTRVTIDGFRARVVIDYLYANHRDQQLEGTFQLRLPEEASPYFFAFGETRYEAGTAAPMIAVSERDLANDPREIVEQRRSAWQAPKEARMVPREKAAFAYGQTVRRRVDPAIVEWAGAGVFSARVFPLAPRKLHRIVVGYDVDLTRIGNDLEYTLDLPEQVPAAVVDIGVADARATISPDVAGKTAGSRRWFHLEDPKQHTIAVRLARPGAPLLVGTDAATGSYFATRVVPALPSTAAPASDTAVFLVDTSLSANPDRFNIWLKLLAAILDNNRGSLKHFGVLFFSVDAHWYKPADSDVRGDRMKYGLLVDNTPEQVAELLAFANTLALEGATDLGAALGEAAHAAWLPAGVRPDLFLLSDGAATWGESDLHALGHVLDGAGRLFAYQTGLAGTDTATLVHLARETGGAVFSVTGEAEIATAATAHRARSWRLTGVGVTGGSDVLVAGNPTALYPGQSVLVVGRGVIAPGAELALTLEQGGKRQVVKTHLGAPLASALAPRAYGQIATAHLEELEAATEGEARAYATHFRITGRTCSLLMLDTDADYERFGIRPDADAYVVKATPAGELFAKALTRAIATLGDPKAAFLALLAKLEHNPDIKLQVPASYRTAIAQIPGAAFAVPSAPLATELRAKSQLGHDLVPQLAKHDLDYDAITAEANARRARSSPADALKALSSLVEENPGDALLARDVGFSAMDLGLHAQAFHLFRRVAEARPHEPQTYRAMAQTLAQMGKLDLALAYYEIPLMGQWDPRFGDLRKIVELDYLRFLRGFTSGKAPSSVRDYARTRLDALATQIGLGRADVVVTITWNTDNTDVDLHVTEPSGEECFYSHRDTRSGGTLTQDVTQGYGPEMYVLRDAPKGRYDIRAHYFALDRNRASARTKVYATVFENWGTKNEKVSEKVVALETGKEFHAIAMVDR
jgi:tetratricopeptide (TPR) repeat protein